MFTTLIDTSTLAAHLDDPAVAIVDCRFRLDDASWGEQDYLSAHIPGAVYAHLDRDLSGAKTGRNGRHPLPAPGALAATLGRLGIDRDVQVVGCDQDTGMWASRLWWLLRWLGHDAVAVLDGGLGKWTAEQRPTVAGREERPSRQFRAGAVRGNMAVTADEVAATLDRPDWRIVDARAPERYRGEVEPIDRTGGHIPGAVDHFYGWNLTESGTFQAPAVLRARLSALTGGVPPDQVVCYCGSGVSACHNLLALERAGLGGARLYPGSWSEWSSDPSRPVERTGQK